LLSDNPIPDLPGYTSPDQVTKETFPLPKLGEKLDDLSEKLHTGQGFYVLRGLDPTRYSALDNVLIYVGVTSYIGSIRGCQDSDGNKLSKKKNFFFLYYNDYRPKIANSFQKSTLKTVDPTFLARH
jgi:hypothetical protein